MEKNPVFTGLEELLIKCPYYESYLEVQCILYEDFNGIFYINRKRYLNTFKHLVGVERLHCYSAGF